MWTLILSVATLPAACFVSIWAIDLYSDHSLCAYFACANVLSYYALNRYNLTWLCFTGIHWPAGGHIEA